MYDDEQMQNIRFEISRALEAVRRQIDAMNGDKSQMWAIYDALDAQRSRLSDIVWHSPHASVYHGKFTKAYNDVDEAAQYFSFAQGSNDDDRPGHLATTARFITDAVEALVFT